MLALDPHACSDARSDLDADEYDDIDGDYDDDDDDGPPTGEAMQEAQDALAATLAAPYARLTSESTPRDRELALIVHLDLFSHVLAGKIACRPNFDALTDAQIVELARIYADILEVPEISPPGGAPSRAAVSAELMRYAQQEIRDCGERRFRAITGRIRDALLGEIGVTRVT